MTKSYGCPYCGVEIPADVLLRSEQMKCHGGGKAFVRWQLLQRQDAAEEPGIPPMGVRVEAGVITSDSPCEDRVVYTHRRLVVMLFYLWTVCTFGGFGVFLICSSIW